MLELKNICKSFTVGVDTTELFKDFNLTINTGDFVSIVGSNGSGKTTMLNIISGSVKQDSGSIILDGKDISNQKEYIRASKIGRVYQTTSMGTAGSMTIAENMAIYENKGKPFNLSRCLNSGAKERYKQMLAPFGLGLEDKLDVPVSSLSGGQRQVITLLTATMTPIDMLILDEHTAALDPKTADTIMELTAKIVKEKKLTVLMVTHNLRYAVEYGNRMIMMHEGKVVFDKSGEEKANTTVNDVLSLFNSISIECGN